MGDVVVCQAALTAKHKTSKQKLLDKAAALNRGVTASDNDKAEIEKLIQEVERTNPTREPLKSPLINGRWELKYTTSSSILGTGRPPFLRPSGPIYQILDAPNGKAANRESAPFFNQVKADITPESSSCVAVQFRQFKVLGLVPVNAPESAKGKLDTTYLDNELRISRGDKGNVFVLTMDDPKDRP
ncbi:hypothetical protein WJX73_009769 [Symbiochloris irregularis]|uniref:Plastid lipid-associated protein/fibrillin conserved domain-containing protein n=1 Tax=Symbiochloris irregularis TaxID=706552 RepID=A0AAW1PW77_9CHLO